MLDRGPPLSLWGIWWNAILLLRPAFSRPTHPFMLFATAVAGLTVRVELLGSTSIVRALNLRPGGSTPTAGITFRVHQSHQLLPWWAQIVLVVPRLYGSMAGSLWSGNGIKAPERDKMLAGAPASAIGIEHQAPDIMGHSMQAVGLLVHAAKSVFPRRLPCASTKAWCGRIAR